MNRRLLMVSHAFPPYQESPGASIRFVKFVKYMARHRPKWQIDIVTAGFCGAEAVMPQIGKYLLDDVPAEVRVFRIDDPYYAGLASPGRAWLQWIRRRERVQAWLLRYPVVFLMLRRAFRGAKWLLRLVNPRRLPSEMPGNRMPIPDAHVVWHEPVLKWLDRQQDVDYDLIFVTIPIVSTALLGVEMKKRLGVPLVVDVRDDWSDYWVPGSEREQLEKPMEQSVVQAADLVVVTAAEIEENYRARHPGLSRIAVIPNGVDLEDFAGLWQTPMPDRFVVTCVGRMAGRSPVPFMRAFRRLLDDQDVDARQCEARFPENMYPSWWQAGFELGLGGHLRGVPVLEREAYLKLLVDSSVLLVVQIQGRTGAIAGKMYEYWATGRPVLLLDTPGAGTAMVERHGFGCSALPDDVEVIYQTLRRLYFEDRARRMPRRPTDAIQAFSREAIALRLIDHLEVLFEQTDGKRESFASLADSHSCDFGK